MVCRQGAAPCWEFQSGLQIWVLNALNVLLLPWIWMSFLSLWVCYTWLAKFVIFIWDKSVLVNLWEGKCWFVVVWVTVLNTKQWGIKSASSQKVNTQVWHTCSVHLLSFVCIWAHSQHSACIPALCWPSQTGIHIVWSAWHVTSKRAVQLPGCTRFQVVPRYWINENSVYQDLLISSF